MRVRNFFHVLMIRMVVAVAMTATIVSCNTDKKVVSNFEQSSNLKIDWDIEHFNEVMRANLLQGIDSIYRQSHIIITNYDSTNIPVQVIEIMNNETHIRNYNNESIEVGKDSLVADASIIQNDTISLHMATTQKTSSLPFISVKIVFIVLLLILFVFFIVRKFKVFYL